MWYKNFRMVQNLVIFADVLVTKKTHEFWSLVEHGDYDEWP